MRKNPAKSQDTAASLHRDVSDRLRTQRTYERFTQAELAEELGLTRAALGNYEYAIRPLPFGVGLRWCQRLDVFPRWLAEGGEPQRPFVTPTQIGVDDFEVQRLASGRVSFLEGYYGLLDGPLKRWLKQNPQEKIILQSLRAGPAQLARRLSLTELQQQIREFADNIGKSQGTERLSWLSVLRTFLDEIEKRTEANRRKTK